MGRLIFAAIAGGVALFLWGFVSHMATPLGMMGVKMHPHEAMLLPAIQQTTTEPGLYMFPGVDPSKKPTKEEEAAWNEKYRGGPHGLLVLGPNGADALSAKRLGTELLVNIVAAFLTVLLLAKFTGGLGGYVSAGAIVFLVGWVTTSVPYWNWYDFPAAFTIAAGIYQVVGGALVGLASGFVLRAKHA